MIIKQFAKNMLNFILLNKYSGFNLQFVQDDTFLCSSDSGSTMCEEGDEGGPLLCPPFDDKGNTKMMIYGVTAIVRNEYNCTDSANENNKLLFSHIMRYEYWINRALKLAKQEDNRVNNTGLLDPDDPNSNETTTSTERLSEYYDTDDYDRTRKGYIRCSGGGRLMQSIYDSSFIFLKRQNKRSKIDVSTAIVVKAGVVLIVLTLVFNAMSY